VGPEGSLNGLLHSGQANRATSPDLLVAQFELISEAQNLPDLSHGQSPGRHSVPPLEGSLCRYDVQRRCTAEKHSGHRENHSGLGRKPFAFPPESLFAFSPESCSSSPRNAFRVHPGIPFALSRNPQYVANADRWNVNRSDSSATNSLDSS